MRLLGALHRQNSLLARFARFRIHVRTDLLQGVPTPASLPLPRLSSSLLSYYGLCQEALRKKVPFVHFFLVSHFVYCELKKAVES
jgi:hypothetical protein